MTRLSVNIDHVATVRQARKAYEPDPGAAAIIAELAGADGITVHLREDRRHINDRDVQVLRDTVTTRLNLEMSIAPDIVAYACAVGPDQATLVPERRQELTTEGGLNIAGGLKKITPVIRRLQKKNIAVSVFIEPDQKQVIAAKKSGAEIVELHTGAYAAARNEKAAREACERLAQAAVYARSLGLRVNAGHGLNYRNLAMVLRAVTFLEEVNIGHAIIARAVLVGIDDAVRQMKEIIVSGSR